MMPENIGIRGKGKNCVNHFAYEVIYNIVICVQFGFCVCSNSITEHDSRYPGTTINTWNLVYQVLNAFFLLDLLLHIGIYGKKCYSAKPYTFYETILQIISILLTIWYAAR